MGNRYGSLGRIGHRLRLGGDLNGGYYVVFVGSYTSKSDAQSALDDIKSDYPDAYVRQIKS